MAIKQKMEQPSKSELKPDWHVVDAEGKTLGRISSEIAVLLQGKHKPGYVPYLNTGDFVVVVNAEKVHVTGKKIEQKKYYRHSGYHGGLLVRKQESLRQVELTQGCMPEIRSQHSTQNLTRKYPKWLWA